MNDRSFEDNERTLKELKHFFFNTSYLWTNTFVFPFVLNYNDFLCFFLLLLSRYRVLYILYVLETPNAFNGISSNYIY